VTVTRVVVNASPLITLFKSQQEELPYPRIFDSLAELCLLQQLIAYINKFSKG